MGSAASGRVNSYAFPAEPEDGTVAADEAPSWFGLGLAVLALVGCIIVGIRIAIGVWL